MRNMTPTPPCRLGAIAVLSAALLLGGCDVLASSLDDDHDGSSSERGKLVQVNTSETGFTRPQSGPLEIPSTDPSGITYHEPTGHLFIVDSEIAELAIYPSLISVNLFEVTVDGERLVRAYDLTDEATGTVNEEPTGIAYSTTDGHFYITNDNTKQLLRYAFRSGEGGPFFEVVDAISTATLPGDVPGITGDFEGVTVDPATGLIYVADGGGPAVLVLRYTEGAGFAFITSFLLEDEGAVVLSDAEGIAVAPDPEAGTLFIVSSEDDLIAEFTTGGVFVRTYPLDALAPQQQAAQGLTFGPASSLFVPGKRAVPQSLYVADARTDNNDDPDERDGRIYEVDVEAGAEAHLAPE